jgi:hypothetical protein
MKKIIITLTLLAGIALNLFAQREIPMFFDKELGLSNSNRYYLLAYSPDGSRLATIFYEKRIVI